MGSVIDWLARVGGDASLRYASAEALARALGDDDVSDELRSSLGDADALRAALGSEVFFTSQMPVEPDREEEEPLDDEDEDEDGEGNTLPRPRKSKLSLAAPPA